MSPYVLFVDDEPENLVVFEATCSERFSVLTASSGSQALELLRTHEVAVLLADQRMPVMTGLELLERAQAAFPQVVRMIVTAYSDLTTAVDAINRGKVRRYLRKPWEYDELLSTLAEAVDYYEMRAKLRAMQRRLVETERVYALGVITSGLSRELKTPLGAVSSGIGRARGILRAMAVALPSEGRAQAALRAQLLDVDEELAEAEVGAQRLHDVAKGVEIPSGPAGLETADASEVLRLTLRLLQSELRALGSFEIDVRPVPLVGGSAAQLAQVLLNLLVNALDGMSALPREKRKLGVRLLHDEPWVKVEIAGSGPGTSGELPPDHFDPWSRIGGPRGYGLGLAISKTIVEAVGGRLEAEAGTSGGARFRVLLPRCQAPGFVP